MSVPHARDTAAAETDEEGGSFLPALSADDVWLDFGHSRAPSDLAGR
jgi:hypothetical protein